jgi:Fur family peroxide stress response transcriptional regulator
MNALQVYEKAKERLGNLALATVYNNLSQLTAEGVIRKISIDGTDYYESYTASRCHGVCPGCGKVWNVAVRGISEIISENLGDIYEDYGLTVKIYCDKCNGRKKK